GLDSENPASLSPAIHDILRNELGFDGVIMTDDIAMGAVADMENVYIKAVNAGNDLLITTDYETAYNQILNAVKVGEISEETLDNAVEHILKLKGLM
ncbi:MAG: glycoside hydrolase family 3 N-terminal domain-containing protein, partial [Hominilimicola sp.]